MIAATLDEMLDRLSSIEPTGFPFISLYLNAEADERGRSSFETFVKKELAERAKSFPEESAERQSFERDAEKILRYVEKEIAPQANGIAIFACTAAEDFFEAVQLGAPVQKNRLFIYEQPHLYPLARIMDQYPRYAVLLASTNSTMIYVFGRGKTLDKERIKGRKTNRTKVGGWSQMRYQRHIENYHLQHIKEVVERLQSIVEEESVEKIVLTGDEVVLPLLREQMPQALKEKVVDFVKLSTDADESEILESTMEVLKESDTQADDLKVRTLLNEYRAEALGVLGVEATLKALCTGQVDELIITAASDGLVYAPLQLEEILKTFEADLTAIDLNDSRAVADELVRRAKQTDARTTFIEDDQLTRDFGGAGALLRYRI